MTEQNRKLAYERLMDVVRDVTFTTSKQLRHAAEAAGFDFVQTDVLFMGDHEAALVLRPDALPALRVTARREQRWHPFHVTDIRAEAA